MSSHVQLGIENGVARLTLDRPDKRNALRREIIEALLECVRNVAAEPSVRVLVIQATGSVFCAGMDLGQMQERAESADAAEEWVRDSQSYCDLLTAIHQLDIPSIARVQGPALAGGVGLVVACDLVVASDNVFFMLPEPMRGITAAMVTPFLIHRIGPGPATFMLLSNERIHASNTFGLCHAVVPVDELESRINSLVDSILGGSRTALAITKAHISSCLESDLPKLVRQSMQVSAAARGTDDAREGLDAFLQKRKPNWQVNSTTGKTNEID